MVRLIVLLAIVGVLTIFALQNTMPITLVIVGMTTPALPLSVWVLVAIAAGAATMATIAGLYRVSNTFAMPSAKRMPRRPTPPDRPSSAGWQAASPTPESPPAERSSRRSVNVSADESWESFSQPLNDNWERGRRQEDWDDWSDEPEPVQRPYQPPYRSPASSSAPTERREPTYDDEPRYQNSRYDDSRGDDWRYRKSRDEGSRDDDWRYEDIPGDDARDEDSPYEDSRYEDSRSGAWYDRVNTIPIAEPASRFADDDYLITFPDEDEEENASPQRDEWDEWDDGGAGAARTEEVRSPDPPSTPRRTEFERPQAPKVTYRSGTVYSYKYRDRDPADADANEGQEADYRVIIPPQPATSASPSASEPSSDAASPSTTNRDDWSFIEDDDWRDRGDRPTV